MQLVLKEYTLSRSSSNPDDDLTENGVFVTSSGGLQSSLSEAYQEIAQPDEVIIKVTIITGKD